MLTDRIITKALGRADFLVFADRSRCLRMRFSGSACPHCTAACHVAAISLDGGINIDSEKCTGCMLCVSACPSGCLSVFNEDFCALLAKVREAQNSVAACVVGCKYARDSPAHVRMSCLGFLSEEHLIALSGHPGNPITLNLTVCETCRNSFIVEKLKKRVQSVRCKVGSIGNRILLIEKKMDLVFEDVPLGRRGFFKAIKTAAFTQVAGLLDEKEGNKSPAYSEKKASTKRRLLNVTIKNLSAGNAGAILSNYAFTVRTGPSCTVCSACVGMCPSGALKARKDASGPALLFNSSLCNGCALCRDFCPAAAVSVTTGFIGRDFFEHELCHADTCMTDAAGAGN